MPLDKVEAFLYALSIACILTRAWEGVEKMDYLERFFPEYDKSFPDTQEKRRAGMAAFRAKLLASHTKILAQMEAGAISAKPRDVQFQRDTIAVIKAAQKRLGEVA